MKKIIAITFFVFGAVFSGFAQERPGANQEPFIGYTVGYGPARLSPTQPRGIPVEPDFSVTDRKELTHGITLGYTHYVKSTKSATPAKVGIGIDVNVQFRGGVRPVFATATGGLVYKPRTGGKVEPFIRVMGGAARLGFKEAFVNGCCLVSTAKYSHAVVAGVGFDVAKKESRLKWRIGVDYVLTQFGERTQHNARVTTGLVF